MQPLLIGCLRHSSSPSHSLINALPPPTVADNHRPLWEGHTLRWFCQGIHGDAFWFTKGCHQCKIWVVLYSLSRNRLGRDFCDILFFFRIGLLSPSSKMTGVFENLNTDMHSNQITSSNYHSLHKSQESPTLPVSTATDSSYYNGQQPGHCAGSPFGQLGTYQYHSSATSSVPYNAKSYDLGFNSSYGTYGSYGSNSSPTPADTGRRALKFVLEHFACIQWLCLWPKRTAEHVWVNLYAQYLTKILLSD